MINGLITTQLPVQVVSCLTSLSVTWMEATWSTFIQMADDTKLRGPVDMLKGRAAMQRDLVCRNEQAGSLWDSTRMNGNKEPFGKIEARVWLFGELLCRKGFGGPGGQWVEHEPGVHPGSGEVYCEVIVSFSLALVKPYVEYSTQLLAAQHKKDIDRQASSLEGYKSG